MRFRRTDTITGDYIEWDKVELRAISINQSKDYPSKLPMILTEVEEFNYLLESGKKNLLELLLGIL